MDWNEFLHEAIAEKDVGLVRQALAQGADPNGNGDDGATPLYRAVSGGEVGIIRAVLQAGARGAADHGEESRTLHAAVEDNNAFVVDLLLEHDGDEALNLFDYVERTPLMIAVQMDNIAIAQRLIAAGANVNAHDEPRIGDTAAPVKRTGSI
jgi:ankyrin repeat protein